MFSAETLALLAQSGGVRQTGHILTGRVNLAWPGFPIACHASGQKRIVLTKCLSIAQDPFHATSACVVSKKLAGSIWPRCNFIIPLMVMQQTLRDALMAVLGSLLRRPEYHITSSLPLSRHMRHAYSRRTWA